MFELLILAVSAQAAAQAAQLQSPPAELLEFLGDWSDQDAEMLDEAPGRTGATPSRQRRRPQPDETQNETNANAQTDR